MAIRIATWILVVLLGWIALLETIHAFNFPPATWSYSVVAPKDEELIQDLNEAGSVGWEAVSARRAIGENGQAARYEILMKRPGVGPIYEPGPALKR